MSRCFPYPPPGYTLSRASNEALIESIKLQKEREKTKAERKKDKRRGKDDKKKLKKEKAKPTTFKCDPCGGKTWGNSKDGILQERKDDSEQLERSSITEERELTQNPSYSSDSTQNSNKRKRHISASNSTCVQGVSASNGSRVQGNILRIRLPSQKSMKCDISVEKQQISSTYVRREIGETIAARPEPDKTCCPSVETPSISRALPLIGPDNEFRQPYSKPPPPPPPPQEDDMHSGHGSKRFKKMQRAVQKYTDLTENWIPPNQQLQCSDANEQDWLFGIKREQKHICSDKISGIENQISCSTGASMRHCAQYLPGADIYALPYTVPF